MGELTIKFSGICGHYTDVVTGVPHRVVMPDASGVHFGIVAWEDRATPTPYCLLPHRVMLRDKSGPLNLSLNVNRGQLLFPARLRVVNAIDQGMEYQSSYETVPRITDYVQGFTCSREVVLLGRAAAYFDFLGGVVMASSFDRGMVTVQIVVQTDKEPCLGIMPMPFDGSPEQYLQLETGDLFVENSDMDGADEDKTFDFLLHYLAAEKGLPTVMRKATPGSPKPRTHKDMALALLGLADFVAKNGLRSGEGARNSWGAPDGRLGAMNASCSDIRYP